MPKYDDQLNYRRDTRTKKQFEEDIKFRTAKEKFLIQLFKKEMVARGHTITYRSYGVDNSGKLVKRATCAPDYRVIIDGVEQLLEIKNSPVVDKWTFKVHNLQQYVKIGADILIFWGTGYIDKNPKAIKCKQTRFGILLSKKIQHILKTYEHYQEVKFGNKICIKIEKKDFNLLLNIEELITCD